MVTSELVEPSAAEAAEQRRSTLQLLWSPWSLAIIVVGVLIRLWIIHTTRGMLSADESYTGLQSAAILDGHFPIVIPGLTYTSPFDSYLMTPMTAVFGQNPVLLKLFPSLAWGAASCMLVAVLRRLSTDRAALLGGAFLWLAPGSLAVISTRAYQSYASGMALVTATALAVVVLIEATPVAADHAPAPVWWRSALAGFMAGFAFYLHPMFLAVVVPLMAIPSWKYRRAVTSWWLPAVGGAVVANAPFLAWNAKNGWPSLAQPAEATDGPLDRLLRFATGLVPRAYGLRNQSGEYVFGRALSVALGLLLLALVVYGAVVLWRRNRALWPLMGVPLIAGWGFMAMFTNTAYVLDGRYAIITFPFVVMALAIGADALLPHRRGVAQLAVAAWVGLFAVPFLVSDTGTDLRDPNAGFRNIAAVLEAKGITRLSGFYWFVFPIELVSDQQIRVSVAGNPYVVLLPNTQRLVQGTPPEEVAFLFSLADEDVAQLRMPAERYDRIVLEGIVLYTPKP
jgi:hypothetical protein